MINSKLREKLYFGLLRLRMVEEKIAEEYHNQEMRCPVHLCNGQEAIPVGVCANLEKEDIVLSHHRSHGHYLAKGGDLKRMIAEIYGKETGCCQGRGGSQHLIDLSVNFLGSIPIVGETIPIAVGSALVSSFEKDKRVSTVFFGEAAVEVGVMHESLNFAVLKKLPIAFVCENNFYSTYSHISVRQPKREIYKWVKGYGLPSYQEDGNEVMKIYRLAKKAVEFIRQGKGPVFLEFITYRHREHVGPNFDPPGFRPAKEIIKWLKKDPLKKMVLPEEKVRKMREKIEKEIEEAFRFAKESPYPSELSEKQVYA